MIMRKNNFVFFWQHNSVKLKISVVLAIILVFLTIFLNLSVPIVFKKIIRRRKTTCFNCSNACKKTQNHGI